MDVDQVSLLLGLLSFIAIAIGVGCLGLVFTGRAETARPLIDLLIPLAFAIALVSTLGSLYYSGIQHYRPCRLCWWQRILMYPLVPTLGIAALRRDRDVAFYGLPLALGGLGYSLWHNKLRWFPDGGTSCDADAPCTAVWVDTFGFAWIPFMAGAGFFAIIGLLALSFRLRQSSAEPVEPQQSEPSPALQE